MRNVPEVPWLLGLFEIEYLNASNLKNLVKMATNFAQSDQIISRRSSSEQTHSWAIR